MFLFDRYGSTIAAITGPMLAIIWKLALSLANVADLGTLKAMSHEAIFLATCLATMTTEKHCKLQRWCHTFAIFFRNLQRPRWKLFTTLSPPAWNLLRAKDGLWLPNFHKIALQVSMDMSHTGYFYFSCNSQRNILLPLQVAKLGCYTWNLSCNLSRNKKLQEKLPRVTWP